MPYTGSTSSSNDAFTVSTTGTGVAGNFKQNNTSTYSSALVAETKGMGSAATFTINNSNNLYGTAISSSTNGKGRAGEFSISNSLNDSDALWARTYGSGVASAIRGFNGGTGYSGFFANTNSTNGSPAIDVSTNGSGPAGYFYGSGTNSKGIYVSVPSGQTGLYVSGGTKNALVATTKGARKLYTEESSEVWFTDYGFGTLQGGITSILIDPLFAETVNLSEKYHVFLQSYSDAEIYVSKRTPSQFEVKMRSGDPNAEFSYRIVAKRKGYEIARLEYEPSGDDDPNLYPEKRIIGGAPKTSSQSIFYQMQNKLETLKKELENK